LIFRYLQRLWLKHILYRSRIPYSCWHEVIASSHVFDYLTHIEKRRLRKLSSLFLHEKMITGAGGLEIDLKKQVYISAHACLLIINLNLDYFNGWSEVIVYPSSFVIKREQYGADGVVHETQHALQGEAWGRGPVVLSWSDAQPNAHSHGPASNVIIHEFAHKLDMLNGSANGMPPLHPNMNRQDWTKFLTKAYNKLTQKIEHHHRTRIDSYAVENPAEFFAVLSEVFFVKPKLLFKQYPDVYRQFKLFYRQDTLKEQEKIRSDKNGSLS